MLVVTPSSTTWTVGNLVVTATPPIAHLPIGTGIRA